MRGLRETGTDVDANRKDVRKSAWGIPPEENVGLLPQTSNPEPHALSNRLIPMAPGEVKFIVRTGEAPVETLEDGVRRAVLGSYVMTLDVEGGLTVETPAGGAVHVVTAVRSPGCRRSPAG